MTRFPNLQNKNTPQENQRRSTWALKGVGWECVLGIVDLVSYKVWPSSSSASSAGWLQFENVVLVFLSLLCAPVTLQLAAPTQITAASSSLAPRSAGMCLSVAGGSAMPRAFPKSQVWIALGLPVFTGREWTDLLWNNSPMCSLWGFKSCCREQK